MERGEEAVRDTVGEDLLSQAGAEAWNQATQLLWKKKATLSGDVLGEVWGKVAWINPKSDSIAGSSQKSHSGSRRTPPRCSEPWPVWRSTSP
jgi:hypothetical protein